MGCRCRERQQALTRTVDAARKGDGQAVAQGLTFVGRTMLEDARSELQRQAQVARARLTALTRRR